MSATAEEAVADRCVLNTRPTDASTQPHRGHGQLIAEGSDLRASMAELTGLEAKHNQAIGGSVHAADLPLGILGANGIVAAGAPIAAGAAWAARNRDENLTELGFDYAGAAA